MKAKMLVMDVDGTMTDGRIIMGPDGEVCKFFNVKDGYGIVTAQMKGIIPVIITGRSSKIVSMRAKELGILELYQGISNKIEILCEVARKYEIDNSEIAYIGDDLNDLECMQLCGISACPNDSVKEVKDFVSYVCDANGGNGAVREFVEYLLE